MGMIDSHVPRFSSANDVRSLPAFFDVDANVHKVGRERQARGKDWYVSDPIVFVSRHGIKEGKLDEFIHKPDALAWFLRS